MDNHFDVIVIGGGHAGLEAASAATRMGMNTAILTSSFSTICKPSCNPNIGGAAKGHIAKEIDALGGVQGLLADKAGIHFKMLNTSKGPAIWSPRAQIDKDLYPRFAYQYLKQLSEKKYCEAKNEINENYGTLVIIEDTAVEIKLKNNKVDSIITAKNECLYTKTAILCAGTFLNGKLFVGQEITLGGRSGEPPSHRISDLLVANGLKAGRLKTGTPPRIHKNSINYEKLAIEGGDEPPIPFHYSTLKVENKIACYATETTPQTHDVLRTGFEQSPMFSGLIQGKGPRYCPSIEDKIIRFSHRENHKILLEPEGLNTDSVYVNGFSTSLPKDVQLAGLRTIAGLENCEMLSPGYAVEYDYFYPNQLYLSLETRAIDGLFHAGQVNGTSGYEEAGSQGLIAGINASLKIKGIPPFHIKRNEAYIGVLIDDLVTKGTEEPYRMFTSLAEYRLLLRQDNANERLTHYGYDFGLIPENYHFATENQKNTLSAAFTEAKNIKLKPNEVNPYFEEIGESLLIGSTSIDAIVKRGQTEIAPVLHLRENLPTALAEVRNNNELMRKLGIEIKYEGYITKQKHEVEYFLENETKRLPSNIKYEDMPSLSKEALQKLNAIRPASLGQASRISGVSATDIAIINYYLKN